MNINENHWKSSKINEYQLETVNANENHRKSMNINENQ